MDDTIIEEMIDYQKRSSLKLIRTQSRRENILLLPMTHEPLVYAHWMSLVLVTSPSVRVIFKSHFMLTDAKRLAAGTYGVSPEQLAKDKATDFFREYCNLVGGDFKIVLVANDQDAVVSLPILTRGFDEIFYVHPRGARRAAWRLAGSDAEFFCSTQIEPLKDFQFKTNTSNFDKLKGEVEFF